MLVRLPALVLCLAMIAPSQDLRAVERLLEAGEYAEALASLQEFPSDSAPRHFLTARALDALDQPTRAAEEAQMAVDLDPQSEAYRLQLGQLFLTRNNPTAAAEIFVAALESFPESQLLHLGAGLALNQLRQPDAAESHFRACLERDPSLGLALDGLVEAHIQELNYEQALAAADQFRHNNPQSYRGYYHLSVVKDKMGAPAEEIEALLAEALKHNDGFAPAYVLLGKVLLQLNRHEEAVLMLEGAVRLKPDYAPGHIHLARAYSATGRIGEAKREMKAAQDLVAIQQQPAPSLRRNSTASGIAGK